MRFKRSTCRWSTRYCALLLAAQHLSALPFTCLVVGLTGCGGGSGGAPPSVESAQIIQLNNEQSLATLKLTEEARDNLAIRTALVVERDMARRRTVGGVIVVPPGQSVTVVAPIAGTIKAPADAALVTSGNLVDQDAVIFEFQPFVTESLALSPADRVNMANATAVLKTSQIDASAEVEAAQLRRDAARIVFERAETLFKSQAGSQRTVQEAKTNLDLAEKLLDAAERRSKFLADISLDVSSDAITTRELVAPIHGVIQNISVAPGETVAAGEPLFEIANLDRMWIRVPIYVGQRDQFDAARDVQVSQFGGSEKQPPRMAKPVAGPRIASAVAASVDLFYELDNTDHQLLPDQKVMATLTMTSNEKSLVVPWASVLYDIHGAAWVYEETAPLTYERRRVDVKFVVDDQAVLAAGPKPNAKIVTDGAAELFGREFWYIIKPGTGKH